MKHATYCRWVHLVTGMLWAAAVPGPHADADHWSGHWQVALQSPGGDLNFVLQLTSTDDARWQAVLINGSERIPVPIVAVEGRQLVLEIPHYDARLTLARQPGTAELGGLWRKRRGREEWPEMKLLARRYSDPAWQDPTDFVGRWSVDFASDELPAVAVVRQTNHRQVEGTFLTSLGDYRFLAGGVLNNELQLSCFDGAHAFLFRAKATAPGTLSGDFWSGSHWHDTWTAQRNDEAAIADPFQLTTWNSHVDLNELVYPDLEGNPVSLGDPRFAGRPRVIVVFGSWCPNCHDAAVLLSRLHDAYAPQGLVVVGLAFEVTGDADRDAVQVRRYLRRHNINYPVLIAGLADKARASQSFPALDAVRAYPTTIFLDVEDRVVGIHTGFAGPATGDAYEQLADRFEQIIRDMLSAPRGE